MGEVILRTENNAGESCNLASINLSKYIDNKDINWVALEKDVQYVVTFLDNVIDKNYYPVKEIEEITKKYRRLGLGIMGFHDALILMELPYDSEDGREKAKEIMNFIHHVANKKSMELGYIKGNYPAYEGSNYKRNHALTCIAPTGSIATISDCSYGIEPIFALKHTRTTWVDGTPKTYNMVASVVDQVLPLMEAEGLDIKKIKEHIFKTGSIQKCGSASIKWKSILKTAMEIEPKEHILMQATFQNNGVDNSISKTINLKTEATEKDVYDAYMLAWKTGTKGTTVYRNGSKKTQVLKTEEYKEKETELHLTKRPNVLSGTTYKMNSGCGKLYVTVNERNGKPYEVFVQTAGNGGCIANTEALGRALSLCLRNEIPVTECIKQMSRVTCLKCKNGKTIDGKSCADIIGKCLSMGVEYENEIPKEKYETTNTEYKSKCPECGEEISMMEGCMTCLNCGYSKCS